MKPCIWPLSLHHCTSLSTVGWWIHLGAEGAFVCSRNFLLLWFCACWEGWWWIRDRQHARVLAGAQHSTWGAQIRWHIIVQCVPLNVRISDHFSYHSMMIGYHGFVLTQRSSFLLWQGRVKTATPQMLEMSTAETCAPFFKCGSNCDRPWFLLTVLSPAGFSPAQLVFIGPLEIWVREQSASGDAWCQGLTGKLESSEPTETGFVPRNCKKEVVRVGG